MILLLLAFATVALVCLLAGARAGRSLVWVGAAISAVAFVWLGVQAPSVLDGEALTERVGWVPQLGLDLSFRMDGFALLCALVVSGIGMLVFAYSWWYFDPHGDQPVRPDLWKLVAFLVAFAGSMLGLVMADGFLTLFVCWELTSITSYLLIGIDDAHPAARNSARQALLVTGVGGLALLAGLVLLQLESGLDSLSGLAAAGVSDTVATSVALALMLVGIGTKSAQVPAHFWLPGAMTAPTPVSAYLHSATMVKAGIILGARVAPAVADTVGWWRPVVVAVGGVTMVVGGIGALRQFDLKLVLAQGTVSQLGLLLVLVGVGTPATTFAGTAIFSAHALFKAALFLGVGIIDHQCHTRDLRAIRSLHRELPLVVGAMAVAAASMAALPPTFGFVAKEQALDVLTSGDLAGTGAMAAAFVVLGSVFTVAYSIRLVWGLVGSWAPDAPAETPAVSPASGGFVAPVVLLAGASLVLGLAAGPVGDWMARVAGSLEGEAMSEHLVLWPGLHLALGLSILAIFGGAGLAVAVIRRSTDRGLPTLSAAPTRAEAGFGRSIEALLVGARRVTAVTQSGSLPAYVAVVLSAVAAALLVALVVDGGATRRPLDGRDVPWANSLVEVVLCVAVVGFALAVPLARRRVEAALLLGGSGFGVAMLFLSWGAPDLALTQVLVEMVSIVMFVLVLRHLPAWFSPAPSWSPKWFRVGLASLVGIVVAGFGFLVSNSRTAPGVGEEMIARSLPEGGGRNVVNVILVDLRGFDTLGEITVVAVAAVGVVNLVAAARREQQRKRFVDGLDEPASGETLRVELREVSS